MIVSTAGSPRFRPLRAALATLVLAGSMLATAHHALATSSSVRATELTLSNGMTVVVVPDNRAPVVTHMVWYRVGAADEPPGKSGIAHFLEHLMFKSTEKIPMGEFSKIVARLGGQDNAFTGHDATAYFQRISKDRLGQMMQMEADRMVNLRLTDKEVLTERDVILEERRSRVDASPRAILDEQMSAALYQNHPYGVPVIGWEHEIAQLTPDDAMAFYKRFYAPNNAILVVAGDVSVEEVRKLAEDSFGRVPANGAVSPTRVRPKEPQHRAPRRVTLEDPRAGKPSLTRHYLAPSYVTAKPGEAEALELLMKIAASGPTSRLYKKLVVDDRVASSASGWYGGSGLDSSRIAVAAVAADGVPLEKVEAAMDAVLADIKANGVTVDELKRAKSIYLADFVYESDSQSTMARRYGWARVTGKTVADVETWPDRIGKITPDEVKAVAQRYLDIRHSVTGTLQVPADAGARNAGRAAGAPG